MYLAGQACITFHRWLSRTDRLDRPDQLVVDLDPSDGSTADVRRAARIIGELMSDREICGWRPQINKHVHYPAAAPDFLLVEVASQINFREPGALSGCPESRRGAGSADARACGPGATGKFGERGLAFQDILWRVFHIRFAAPREDSSCLGSRLSTLAAVRSS